MVPACGGETGEAGRPGAGASDGAAVSGAGDPRSAADAPSRKALPRDASPGAAAGHLPRVVFLGDSLTAGYGLSESETFAARVAELLAAEGTPIEAINAGVSGDTSAGGLARLDWVLRQRPDVLVVELGPNDGLRGLPLDATEENLREVIHRGREAGARVLLVGLRIPPNYGPEYADRFRDLYPRLAEELDVPLVPFLLAGVGGEPELNLPDGLHPNAEGHRRLAATVLPHLRPLVTAAANG